ncbi:MAG: deoxyribonuclease V [Candidatus Syntropharchaeia archaeon]
MELETLKKIQERIAERVIKEDEFERIRFIGGADGAFFRKSIISGIVVLSYDSMEVIESVHTIRTVNFPYIPGFLSFREMPGIIDAFSLLERKPDVLMIDGCGINHPRFAGLATHVGVKLDIPTIGVSKNLLCGNCKTPQEVGDARKISFEEKEVGWMLKSKKGCRPIVVAPGHKVSLDSSIKIVKHCLRGYKLPEPTRQAHLYVNKIKRSLDENKNE